MKGCNVQIANEIMNNLPEGKIKALVNACIRNEMLTTTYGLEQMTMTVYKEGWLLTFNGCRSQFRVFAKDNDGEVEITRKPNESKLHKIYDDWARTEWVIDLYELTREYV